MQILSRILIGLSKSEKIKLGNTRSATPRSRSSFGRRAVAVVVERLP